MRVSALLLALFTISACTGKPPTGDGADNGGTDTMGTDDNGGDSQDSETAETAETGETGETSETAETAETAETGETGDSDSGPVDKDGDGYTADRDCDDSDPEIHPGADEHCDGVDEDCDGSRDEDAVDATAWYADGDRDSYGAGRAMLACEQPKGYVADSSDCNDRNDDVHPGAVELCNGIDDDCDASIDEDAIDPSTWYPDDDADGHGDASDRGLAACEAPDGYVASHDDCDDGESTVNPDAVEVCNEVDDDCNGMIDDGATDALELYPDTDGDGYGDEDGEPLYSCEPVAGYSGSNLDCDDTDEGVNPDAVEVCDGVDNDCNGRADGSDAVDATTVWPDRDGDTYGDAGGRPTVTCTVTGGFSTNDDDCDDSNRDVNPGEDEACNGIDDNCDGVTDGDDAIDTTLQFADVDGDGFGDAGTEDYRCWGSPNDLDCDDADATEPQVVDAAATGTPDGTLGAPWANIQDGIDAADECVLVAAGLYDESIDFGGKGLLVASISGAAETVIDGGRRGPVVTFAGGETAAAELRGFTVTNGSGYEESTSSSYTCGSSVTCTDYFTSYCGGGVYVDGATPTLTQLVIYANDLTVPADYTSGNDTYSYFSFGGGLCVRNAALELRSVGVYDNYAVDGGGVYVEAAAELTYRAGEVSGNASQSGGGFEVDGGALTLENAVVASNTGSSSGGGVLLQDATGSFVNVTLGTNSAPTGGGVYVAGTSSGSMRNGIIYGSGVGIGVYVDGTATWSQRYSDVYGNTDGNFYGVTDPTGTLGNVSSDPLFAGVSADGNHWNDDWHLSGASPLVNAGDPLGVYNDADGTRNDVGAYGGPEGSGW